VGFYHGASLPDPSGLLQGEGKRMRHVKLRLGTKLDSEALGNLIAAAYHDIRKRLGSDRTAMKKQSAKKTTGAKASASPSSQIDAGIKELGDWRGDTLARVRAVIKQADPEVVETWKWRGVPVWEDHGIICTGETYRDKVKLTFAKGAKLKDPSRLFNS